jgi:hypothetical protein
MHFISILKGFTLVSLLRNLLGVFESFSSAMPISSCSYRRAFQDFISYSWSTAPPWRGGARKGVGVHLL